MFLSTAEDSIGDLSLYSVEMYKEYILCVGGISKAHAPFKGYKFIPALHVTDSCMFIVRVCECLTLHLKMLLHVAAVARVSGILLVVGSTRKPLGTFRL